MKSLLHSNAGLLVLALAPSVFAAPATWSSVAETSATGSVSGIGIQATTSPTAPFAGLATHRFAHTNVPCGGWNADGFELDPSATALTTTSVNGGDFQQFDFDATWANGLFYIENFDSNSRAMIMVTGGAQLELVAASPSISFDAATSTLESSNVGFDGEGDAVLRFLGNVDSVRLDYKAGLGANGVFYTFADGQPVSTGAVPEPTSFLIWGSLVGMLLLVKTRKNKKANP